MDSNAPLQTLKIHCPHPNDHRGMLSGDIRTITKTCMMFMAPFSSIKRNAYRLRSTTSLSPVMSALCSKILNEKEQINLHFPETCFKNNFIEVVRPQCREIVPNIKYFVFRHTQPWAVFNTPKNSISSFSADKDDLKHCVYPPPGISIPRDLIVNSSQPLPFRRKKPSRGRLPTSFCNKDPGWYRRVYSIQLSGKQP